VVFDNVAGGFKSKDEGLRGWYGHAEMIVEGKAECCRFSQYLQLPRRAAHFVQEFSAVCDRFDSG
jgi:hypothetical protein